MRMFILEIGIMNLEKINQLKTQRKSKMIDFNSSVKNILSVIMILIFLYVCFEFTLILCGTCGVCHPIGHFIAIIYLIIVYFVLMKYSFFKQKAALNPFWKWLVFIISIVAILIYLVMDFALFFSGLTVEGEFI